MKKKINKYLATMLTMCLLIGSTGVLSQAATKHLLIINTKKNTMGYYVNNKLVKEFRVATGKSNTPTPTGKTTIVNKIKNRPYYSGGIPGGDPRNPLGDRWLGLNLKGSYGDTYGIHGNNNENSIGQHVSGGCIRMHNNDVRWLFDQIPNKSDVILKYTDQSFKQIAAGYKITLDDNSKPKPPDKPNPPAKKGWETKDGKKYYYDSKGQKVTNLQTIDGNKYYFDKNGVMQTGWQSVVEGRRSYFGSDGAMKAGWQDIDGNRYYLNNSNGVALRYWQEIDGNKYYFGSDEIVKTGWQDIDGGKYYFNSDGSMQQRWENLDGSIYYFGEDGRIRSGWQEINGEAYHFNNDGVAQVGLQDIDGNKYYFYEDGKMARDTVVEDGIEIDENGIVTSVGEGA
ncbi:L,D-transpeptidase family protein [Romboutsia sedimentorum]|uniref:L,D-transpeptidase family protein n=1 Tax=Romboutsia sedimentorum TaxID=1368474 RepID=A0ABT7E7S8_9FIRM|nr:L,D-transpeptidase family protein [Romboutsia sedimentorum]MDK2562932.1 L,D-transpeptidase family protein [Romboutsia sedimentorum]